MSINLIQNKEQETNHLRGKSRFYIAGWVANRECENPQKMPKEHKNNLTMKEWYDEYMQGYGDSFANSEALSHN